MKQKLNRTEAAPFTMSGDVDELRRLLSGEVADSSAEPDGGSDAVEAGDRHGRGDVRPSGFSRDETASSLEARQDRNDEGGCSAPPFERRKLVDWENEEEENREEDVEDQESLRDDSEEEADGESESATTKDDSKRGRLTIAVLHGKVRCVCVRACARALSMLFVRDGSAVPLHLCSVCVRAFV